MLAWMVLIQTEEFWPQTLAAWAQLLAPLALIIAALGWIWQRSVKPMKDSMTKSSRGIRNIRRLVHTYIGKVELLERSRETDQIINGHMKEEMGVLSARLVEVESTNEKIDRRLTAIEKILELQVVPALNRIQGGRDK